MLSTIKSCGLYGINGYVIDVETDISNGLPAFEMVGLADTAVRESKERVRAAIKNSNMEFPIRKITVNLAPAGIKKEGSMFDLPIAIGILTATGQINNSDMELYMFVGELSLNGDLKPVRGVLPIALGAKEAGADCLILPEENAAEAAVVQNLKVLPARTIKQVVEHLNSINRIDRIEINIDQLFSSDKVYDVDFADVKGQENVKRALEVAASGGHNCIMVGSPGTGKTMLAKRIPTILPDMSFEEALEVTKIHSISGLLPSNMPLVVTRPFRSPHHTISSISLVGGGRIPKPGEISLAHYGVLFLDELPEFGKDALEVLRQPLEDGEVNISRIQGSITYPADITFVCAANPCKCGKAWEAGSYCTCTPLQVHQYLGKLSGPLLDRIDMHIEVLNVKILELENCKIGETSKTIRQRVNTARKLQRERYIEYGIFSNSQLHPSMMYKFCSLDLKSSRLLKDAFEKFGMSARAHNRILKVSRTIADMDESDDIKAYHLAEAIQYRSLDRKFGRF